MQVLPLLSGVIGELDLGGHDYESHYDLWCVDVNCSNWRSHSDVACSVFVSLLHRHVQILLGVEEECNMASPSKCTSLLSLLQPLSLLVIPFLHSSTSHRVKNSSSIPPSSYEFPNGYNQSFTVEKFKLCEGLFDSSTPNLKVQQTTCDWLHTLSGIGDLSHVSKHQLDYGASLCGYYVHVVAAFTLHSCCCRRPPSPPRAGSSWW